MHEIRKVLALGATGSVGQHVVEQLVDRGLEVRAVTRNPARASFPRAVEVVAGDIAEPNTITGALDDIDAVIFTHGANGTAEQHRRVDYGAVYNVVEHANEPLRIALMTAIYVTDHEMSFNRTSEVFDWKRRSERLVRASRMPYTIVRPSWFDFNEPDQRRLVFRQGDRHTSGGPADGVIARDQIAHVLIDSLFTDEAAYKTFELAAETGQAQHDLTPLFAELPADIPGTTDAVEDRKTLPLQAEPEDVIMQMERIRRPRY